MQEVATMKRLMIDIIWYGYSLFAQGYPLITSERKRLFTICNI